MIAELVGCSGHRGRDGLDRSRRPAWSDSRSRRRFFSAGLRRAACSWRLAELKCAACDPHPMHDHPPVCERRRRWRASSPVVSRRQPPKPATATTCGSASLAPWLPRRADGASFDRRICLCVPTDPFHLIDIRYPRCAPKAFEVSNRSTRSMVALNARAVTGPTPGIVINLRVT